LERVIDPIVADIQTEHEKAVRAGRRANAARIRVNGYLAFWSAMALHLLEAVPRALWKSVAADQWALGRIIAYSLLALIVITLLLSAEPMIVTYARVQSVKLVLLLLPQAIVLSIPIALSLVVVSSAYRIRLRAQRIRRVLGLAVVATMLAFAAFVALVPEANQAYRVTIAQALGMRGVTEHSLPRGMSELSLSELASRIGEYEGSGSSKTADLYRRAYHLRFALPAATFVLSLLALAICAIVRRRAVGVVTLVVGFGVYYALLSLAIRLAVTTFPPIVSVWVPNVVLTAVSLLLLKAGYNEGPSTHPSGDPSGRAV
jgi:hypothetical protein